MRVAAAVQEQRFLEATAAHSAASIRPWLVSFAVCAAHFVPLGSSSCKPKAVFANRQERNRPAITPIPPEPLSVSQQLQGLCTAHSARSGRVNNLPNHPNPSLRRNHVRPVWRAGHRLRPCQGREPGAAGAQGAAQHAVPVLAGEERSRPNSSRSAAVEPCLAPQPVLIPVAAGHRQCHRQAQVD